MNLSILRLRDDLLYNIIRYIHSNVGGGEPVVKELEHFDVRQRIIDANGPSIFFDPPDSR